MLVVIDDQKLVFKRDSVYGVQGIEKIVVVGEAGGINFIKKVMLLEGND